MSKFDKVMATMRSIVIAVAMIVTCGVGMAYIADDVMYESELAAAIAFVWLFFSGYKIIRWTITEIKGVILYK